MSGALDFYPVDTSSTPLQVVTVKIVSRCCQVFPEGQNSPSLRTTGLEGSPASLTYKTLSDVAFASLVSAHSLPPQGTPIALSLLESFELSHALMPPYLCTPSPPFPGHLSQLHSASSLLAFKTHRRHRAHPPPYSTFLYFSPSRQLSG